MSVNSISPPEISAKQDLSLREALDERKYLKKLMNEDRWLHSVLERVSQRDSYLVEVIIREAEKLLEELHNG